MVSNKLKEIIFNKLYLDLKNVEIISFEDNIWFIDREKKYWYLEVKSFGSLWWRYDFFRDYVLIFSVEQKEITNILCQWVEEVLKCKLSSFVSSGCNFIPLIDEILETRSHMFQLSEAMEIILNHKK